jgi:hypothetical protein
MLAAAVVAGVALSATRANHDGDAADGTMEESNKPDGVLGRAKASVVEAVGARARELEHELRRASESIGRAAGPPSP